MEPLSEVASQCGSGMAASLPPSRWADLPADLLIDISGRLRDVVDFVRFHAVCSPWRRAAPSLPSPAATHRTFLPWLLAMWDNLLVHLPLNFGCILALPTSSDRHGRDSFFLPDEPSTSDAMNWVVREDGAAVWAFTAYPRPTLTDVLTRAVTKLPRFSEVDADDDEIKWQMSDSRGIVYRDGTVFLYNFYSRVFRAAILRPGDTTWTTAERSLTLLEKGCHLSAAYHDGEILVCVRLNLWFILKPDFKGKGVAGGGELDMMSDARGGIKRHSYVFESHGELMWATVLAKQDWCSGRTGHDPAGAVSVTVHALERAYGGAKMRWVAMDGQSLSDRVLFLGSPTSFTMDDTPTGVGGCAFFFLRGFLLKYSFINGEAKLMDGLSPKWGSVKAHVWLQPPPPAIAPMNKIRKRANASTRKKARKNNKQFSGLRAPRKLLDRMESFIKAASQSSSGVAATPASLVPPRWADLPADLLDDISGRLHDVAEFVRFHAVCSAWREAAPSLLSPAATQRTFLPWPLAMWDDLLLHLPLNFGCISPTSSYRHGRDSLALPGVSSTRNENWVAREDGAAVWLFTTHPQPTLADLRTGGVIKLPRFSEDDHHGYEIKRRMENSRGIVYRDGTVFLYSFARSIFTAAILRPDDTAWTTAEKRVGLNQGCHLSAAYHDGNILVCISMHFWFVLTPDFEGKGGAGGGKLQMRSDATDEIKRYSYVFESCNELMWVTILVGQDWDDYGCMGNDPKTTPTVTVHTLVGANGGKKMRWMPRDGQSLRDRVLFLGSPLSFTGDATHLGMDGGCAYFVFKGCVFRYNLIDGEAKLMEQLSPKWGSDKVHVWLQPYPPAIASIYEIRKRAKASTKKEAKKYHRRLVP
ncbi:hypothetical protein VPH35_093075 [Triticum aestivum]